MKRQCRCSSRQIENYRQRISGPLLDRIDIHCEVPLVDFRELSSNVRPVKNPPPSASESFTHAAPKVSVSANQPMPPTPR
jgi:predicted ATPase with chaperone activity